MLLSSVESSMRKCILFPSKKFLSPFPPFQNTQVRQAFTADLSEDHSLIVADYGQLELRILAHVADCR